MVFDFLRRADAPAAAVSAVPEAPEVKASATGRVVAFATGGRVAWSPRDTVSLTKSGFLGNPVGFRAVKLVAEAAAALPLVLQDAERRYDVHPLLDLTRRPNAAQGRAEFLEAVYGQLILTGNAYIEAVPGTGRLPGELHVLRSDRMSVVPGPDGWPIAYDYVVGAKRHRFDVRDVPVICHLRCFHPQDDHYGFSPMQAAAVAVDVHASASRWSKALMETNHQGSRNAGRPMLLEGGLDWKPMGFSPSDMEFHKTKEAAAREIAIAFGVPPMLVGIPGDATYANYQEANRAFFRLTVLPLATKVLADITHWLSVFSGEPVELRPDLDQVPALAVERDQQWARVGAAAFLSDAEKRAILGLPPLMEGA